LARIGKGRGSIAAAVAGLAVVLVAMLAMLARQFAIRAQCLLQQDALPLSRGGCKAGKI
jgi:hypothetical protein